MEANAKKEISFELSRNWIQITRWIPNETASAFTGWECTLRDRLYFGAKVTSLLMGSYRIQCNVHIEQWQRSNRNSLSLDGNAPKVLKLSICDCVRTTLIFLDMYVLNISVWDTTDKDADTDTQRSVHTQRNSERYNYSVLKNRIPVQMGLSPIQLDKWTE